jgi:hypothetical protein
MTPKFKLEVNIGTLHTTKGQKPPFSKVQDGGYRHFEFSKRPISQQRFLLLGQNFNWG